MRYEQVANLVRLAVLLQGSVGGMTISEIASEFRVSRRTAERMRNAVEDAFGPLLPVETLDRQSHWRLQSRSLRGLIQIAPDELVELESAADQLEHAGLTERSKTLRELGTKVRAAQQMPDAAEFDSDYEMLLHAEGLAMRPGPRITIEPGLLRLIRSAIKSARQLAFKYNARRSGRESEQLVKPYGILYGNRPYLVGAPENEDLPHLWLLPNMSNVQVTEHSFEWDSEFDLQTYAERSFGVFQEEPFQVVLRFNPDAAEDAANFLFHPSQTVQKNRDGSLTVTFTAGGIVEMCWHLVTWGSSVSVEQPKHLREHIARVCEELAAHHSGTSD